MNEKAGTILIVDDETDVRELMRDTLEDLQYAIIDVATGIDAIQVCRTTESIQLVISDLLLPTMNGAQLVSKLSILQPGIKALLISGDLGNARREDLAGIKTVDYLAKPFRTNELVDKVVRLLQQK